MRSPMSRTMMFWLGCLLLAAGIVALLCVDPLRHAVTGAMLPFLRAKTEVTARAELLADRMVPLDGSERARLRYLERLVLQLQQQLRNSQNAQEENRELRLYQELPASTGWRLVVAPIIARDPVSWNRSFRLGKGTRHGLLAGAVVMAGNQVIGRIAEVTLNSALVLTLADPGCKLSVRLPSANAVGILAGREEQAWHAAPLCRITALPRDGDYHENEPVVTSGLGETTPAGLPVGRVVPWEDRSVIHIVDTAYVELLVQPGAEYSVFHNVAVVVPQVTDARATAAPATAAAAAPPVPVARRQAPVAPARPRR